MSSYRKEVMKFISENYDNDEAPEFSINVELTYAEDDVNNSGGFYCSRKRYKTGKRLDKGRHVLEYFSDKVIFPPTMVSDAVLRFYRSKCLPCPYHVRNMLLIAISDGGGRIFRRSYYMVSDKGLESSPIRKEILQRTQF